MMFIGVFAMSCMDSEDTEVSNTSENNGITTIITGSLDGQDEKQEGEVLTEMLSMVAKLHEQSTGKKLQSNPSEETMVINGSLPVSPPYYASNVGDVYINRNFVTGQSDRNDNLSFGNRAPHHTTQWVSLNLTDIIGVRDVGVGASNNVGSGRISFYLKGVNQRVNLNYRVNAPSSGSPFRSITVTPSSPTANFLRNNIVPSTILIANGIGPIQLTIHANEFGWLWLKIEQGGIIKYDQHYRFNYSSNFDNKNGGSISISGYNPMGLPFIPYTFFWAQQNYSGYCGWF